MNWSQPLKIAVMVVLNLSVFLQSMAVAPGWWSSRGVFKTGNPSADDYAVINQGQLKNLVRAAVDEMNEKLPLGADQVLNDLVHGWQTSFANADDYAAVNIGQLKNVAAKVYDRLIAIGHVNAYPWAGSTNPKDDYALANIGQAKAVFSFPINFTPPQAWYDWLALVGLPANTPINSVNGAGQTNWQKFSQYTSQMNNDTDGDGVTDADEIIAGTNPTKKDNPVVGLTAYGYSIP